MKSIRQSVGGKFQFRISHIKKRAFEMIQWIESLKWFNLKNECVCTIQCCLLPFSFLLIYINTILITYACVWMYFNYFPTATLSLYVILNSITFTFTEHILRLSPSSICVNIVAVKGFSWRDGERMKKGNEMRFSPFNWIEIHKSLVLTQCIVFRQDMYLSRLNFKLIAFYLTNSFKWNFRNPGVLSACNIHWTDAVLLLHLDLH